MQQTSLTACYSALWSLAFVFLFPLQGLWVNRTRCFFSSGPPMDAAQKRVCVFPTGFAKYPIQGTSSDWLSQGHNTTWAALKVPKSRSSQCLEVFSILYLQVFSEPSQYTVPCIHIWPLFNSHVKSSILSKGLMSAKHFCVGGVTATGILWPPLPAFDSLSPPTVSQKLEAEIEAYSILTSRRLGELRNRSWNQMLDEWKERRNIRLASGQEGTHWRCAMKLSQMDSFSECHFASKMKASLSLGLRKAFLLSQNKRRN